MCKSHFDQNLKFLTIAILLGLLITGCSKDEKCYTCEGYQGSLYQEVSNVCGIGPGGEPLVNYYLNMGWKCRETESKSKSVSSITGPDDNFKSETNLIETEDSDCPCKEKNNSNDESKKTMNRVLILHDN